MKNRSSIYRLLLFPLLWLPILGEVEEAQASAKEDKTTLAKADSLYRNFEEEQALKLYRDVLQQNPSHYKALWRISYLYARIGNRLDDEDQQSDYYNNAVDFAQRALKVDSSDVHSNFVMAVAKGRKALISGAKDRVAASRDIKRYAEKARSLDPNHAGSHHLLGRWHAKITNLNFAERMAAKYLFGGIPEASVEKARQRMEKAVELQPRLIRYRYDLAKLYERLGEDEKAEALLKETVAMEPMSPVDPKLLKKSRELLEDVR